MTDFTILGRIEKRAGGDYRVMAAAVPHGYGKGPGLEDIRMANAASRGDARSEMGLLAHAIATAVLARGDQLVRVDLGK